MRSVMALRWRGWAGAGLNGGGAERRGNVARRVRIAPIEPDGVRAHLRNNTKPAAKTSGGGRRRSVWRAGVKTMVRFLRLAARSKKKKTHQPKGEREWGRPGAIGARRNMVIWGRSV